MLIRNFALNKVELCEPVLENAFRKEQEYLRSIDADRLLAGFREIAGLTKKAERYQGGWEDAEIAGHTLGHYLTALSQLYAATGAKDIGERLNYILSELAECQLENGFLFASPERLFDRLEQGEPAWVPWYTMHKVLAGLLSTYQLGGCPRGLELAIKLGIWVYDRTKDWTDEVRERVLLIEYGGMNDVMYELYKETGRKEFAEAAAKFDETELFLQIAQGKDILQGKHANTTIPKFLGALNRYFALGESEEFYFKAAQSFFDIVLENHTYVTGGNSEWEHFRAPATLGRERTQCNCETCNTHNMLKLAEGLFFVTGEKRYMDFYERTFLNAVLGSQNPETGMTMYFQPMAAGYFKTYSTPFENFWCCTGTGMENFTKLNSGIYHTGENRLYVNLYLASVLHDEKLNLDLIQKTDLNYFDSVQLSMKLQEEKEFALALRIPEWTKQRFEVKINGQTVDYAVQKGYILLERRWAREQQISLRFFPEITLHTLPDAPYSAAVTYGPFVLAAGLGQSQMSTELTGVFVTIPTKKVPVREQILIKEISVREWFADCKKNFVKAEGELAFYLRGTDADGELLFTPYYKHYNDRYGIYFDYVAEAGLSEGELRELTKKQEEIAELAALEAQTQEALYQENQPMCGEETEAQKYGKKAEEEEKKPGEKKKASKKNAKKESSEEVTEKMKKKRKGHALRVALAHVAGALALLLLLYLFADPIGRVCSRAKGAVDAFLQKRMPGVAEVFGVSGDGEGNDVSEGQEGTDAVKRYLDHPEETVAAWILPEGYQAFVSELSGNEYICVEGKGLRVYYPNEVQEEGKSYIYLESMTDKAVYFWDYSLEEPESLCFARSVHNTAGAEQYVYYENDTPEGLHLLDVKTLKEHTIASYAKELSLLADIGAYTEEGDSLLLDTVIQGVSYLFSVPRAEGAFEMTDYVLHADRGLVYTLEQNGIRFDAYVMSAGVYLGKVVGKLSLQGQGYVLNSLDFYAYAEETYADPAGDAIIRGVTKEEADRERIVLTGDLGEKLLVTVREDVEKHTYVQENFVKDEAGEYTYLEDGQNITVKGVDVSKYQETIDWNKVAADGVEFAMIRLGFRGMGTQGTCELDPYFKQNMEGATAAGVETGVYFFTQATTVEEAREEARFVIDNLKGYNVTWPVVYDTEAITSYKAARANNLSREVRTACAKAFLEEIKAAGYTPMLYANTRWSILKLDLAQLSDYDFWYAYYGDEIYYPYKFSMWQYSSNGTVDGIKGKADLNISFVDYGAER